MAEMRAFLRDRLVGMLAIPSLSTQEGQMSDYVYEQLRSYGLEVERDTDGNVTAWKGNGDRILAVNGHLDTVPPGEGWETDPYTPQVDGDFVTGLGASDMKSGLAVMLHAARVADPGKLRVAFAFTVNEEGGGETPRNGVHAFLNKVTPDYAITCEGSYDPKSGRLAVGLGCQGRILADVTMIGKTAHSAYFREGINAIYLGARLIQRVEAMAAGLKPRQVVDGVYSSPALSVVQASGGIARNVIPDRFRLAVDRRLGVGETFETFEAEMAELTAGLPCEVAYRRVNLPTVANLSGPLYKTARDTFDAHVGSVQHELSNGRLDLCYFAQKTSEVLNFGPGHAGEFHRPQEKVSISAMEISAHVLVDLIARMGEV